jgi:hypothetical protein
MSPITSGRSISRSLIAAIVIAAVMTGFVAHAIEEQAADLAAQKAELAKLQSLVGSWKGVAQPQRGSNKGSWVEQAEWAWKFRDGKAELEAAIGDSKVFSTVKVQSGEEPGNFVLSATPVGADKAASYSGKLDDSGKLTAVADGPNPDLPARISIRTVAGGDRLLVLYEKKSGTSDQLVRLAEVGYTRKGSGFGKGSSGPECVVTGGFGSIVVTHKGKEYFVCCTGCRDYFNEQPDEVLADYAERKAEEKRKATEEK